MYEDVPQSGQRDQARRKIELSSLRSPTLCAKGQRDQGTKGKDRSAPQIDFGLQASNEGIRHPFYVSMQGQDCFSRVSLETTKAIGRQDLGFQLGGGADDERILEAIPARPVAQAAQQPCIIAQSGQALSDKDRIGQKRSISMSLSRLALLRA